MAKKTKKFSILYTNADSLLNKRSELKFMLDSVSAKPSVIIIIEVKPKTREIIDVAEFAINGYNIFANDFENLNARGIIIYINKNFNANSVDLNFDYSEYLAVRIKKFDQREDLTIIAIYRSPNSLMKIIKN